MTLSRQVISRTDEFSNFPIYALAILWQPDNETNYSNLQERGALKKKGDCKDEERKRYSAGGQVRYAFMCESRGINDLAVGR